MDKFKEYGLRIAGVVMGVGLMLAAAATRAADATVSATDGNDLVSGVINFVKAFYFQNTIVVTVICLGILLGLLFKLIRWMRH